ncbi:hypothetical protein QTP88_019611 [Uroleucon formosanum]
MAVTKIKYFTCNFTRAQFTCVILCLPVFWAQFTIADTLICINWKLILNILQIKMSLPKYFVLETPLDTIKMYIL